MTTKNFKTIEVFRTSGYKYFLKKPASANRRFAELLSLLVPSPCQSSIVNSFSFPSSLSTFSSPSKSRERWGKPFLRKGKGSKARAEARNSNFCIVSAAEAQIPKIREFKLFVHSTFLEQNTISDGRGVFVDAVNMVKPILGVVKTRIRGRAQYIPKTMSKPRQNSLALRWFCQSFQEQQHRKKERTRIKKFRVSDYIALEFLKAAHGNGFARKRRNDFHKLAEANRVLLRKK